MSHYKTPTAPHEAALLGGPVPLKRRSARSAARHPPVNQTNRRVYSFVSDLFERHSRWGAATRQQGKTWCGGRCLGRPWVPGGAGDVVAAAPPAPARHHGTSLPRPLTLLLSLPPAADSLGRSYWSPPQPPEIPPISQQLRDQLRKIIFRKKIIINTHIHKWKWIFEWYFKWKVAWNYFH